uniref:Large subunit GTPase 1 homolog n=1 Tax=Haemonchus contortus TaxID=6289 RepID=A0A7I4XW92_HAECO
MTKRRPSNKKPTGVNKSLGNSLMNERVKVRQAHQRSKYDAEEIENPAFMDVEAIKNIDSITEETSLEEFLAKANLAGTEFTAERQQFRVIEKETAVVVPSRVDYENNLELQRQLEHKLKIPRRPPRALYNTAEELTQLENESFLKWRSELAELQENDGLTLTPFERNPEMWRELWRVVERSDVVVQIVDARNPLLFWSKDLDAYVKEVDPAKKVLLLLNKADLLEEEQIAGWAKYFAENQINAAFWTALEVSDPEEECNLEPSTASSSGLMFLRTRDQLVQYLKEMGHVIDAPGSKPVVVGMVGYPNVGKSSTINRIAGSKKVSVSATPGKTRHFQTVHIDDQLVLCDCPGLVMPSFAFGRNEMFLNGILPVDQMRDHFGPIALLLSRIPVSFFEQTYSVMLPENSEPSALNLLTSIAFMRGFMSASGIPDCSRAARFVIKDLVCGRLRWVAPPPGIDQNEFNSHLFVGEKSRSGRVQLEQLEKRGLLEGDGIVNKKVDSQFFNDTVGAVHTRSAKGNPVVLPSGEPAEKGDKRHHNKNKKEKLRRIYVSTY